jgi:hypothetical protein
MIGAGGGADGRRHARGGGGTVNRRHAGNGAGAGRRRLDQGSRGHAPLPVRLPQHKNGFPPLHILNYINTYSQAHKTGVGAVGTFYAVGSQSSIPLAFNDNIWASTARGVHRPQRTRQARYSNVFNQPTPKDCIC